MTSAELGNNEYLVKETQTNGAPNIPKTIEDKLNAPHFSHDKELCTKFPAKGFLVPSSHPQVASNVHLEMSWLVHWNKDIIKSLNS